MKKSYLISIALVFALAFSALAAGGGGRGGGRGGGGGGGRGGGGGGGMPGGGGGRGGGGGMPGGGGGRGGGMNMPGGGGRGGANVPGNDNGATNNANGGTNTTRIRTGVTTPKPATNAVVSGRYHVTATLTRVGTNLVSFRLSTNRLEYSLKMDNSTKVLLESEDVKAKTTAGTLTDLEAGQRIKINHNGSVISDITVLKEVAEKAKDTDTMTETSSEE
jgi:hypothetical protein